MNVPGKTRVSKRKHLLWNVRSNDVESTWKAQETGRVRTQDTWKTSLQGLPSKHSPCVPWFLRPL